MQKKIQDAILKTIILMISLLVINGCKDDNNNATNPGGGGNPGANEVFIISSSFSPLSRTITAGTGVTWTNKDQTAHTVTSGAPGAEDGLFDSGNMNTNATYSHVFNTAGTFRYFCKIHGAMMTGTVIVQQKIDY